MKKEALRVSTTIPAAPTTLYLAWLSADQHSAMTGATAKIDPSVGGKFTAWNGYISGKLVTLDLGRRIVMSWRTADFPREATDSRVEVHFEALGGSTRLTILHTDIPEGQGEQYRAAWNDKYFAPIRTFFSKYLPDPRKPPPPRRPAAEEAAPEEEEEHAQEEEPEEAMPKKVAKPVKAHPPSAKIVAAPPAKPVAPKPVPSKAAPAKPARAKKAAAPKAAPKTAAKKAAPAKKMAEKPAKKKPAKKK